MFRFYALSLLSGFFEIAPFVVTLRSEGVLATLIIALCYQLGNLVPCPLRLSHTTVKAATLIGPILLAVYCKTGSFPLLCAATTLLSMTIQSARSMAKANASKALKRFLRVAGFGIGLLGSPLLLLIVGTVNAVFVYTGESGASKNSITAPHLNGINIAMVLHQIHYFSYCYAAIAFAANLLSMAASLSLFLSGWAVYILAARLYRGLQITNSFFFGHTLLVLLLMGMFFAPSMAIKAVLWILTGVGGTTEFCLARLSLNRGGTPDGGTFSENTGHILGIGLSIIVYAITKDTLVTLFVSVTAVLGAILLTAVTLHNKGIIYNQDGKGE